MATISDFVVGLSLDGRQFERGIRQAESSLNLFKSSALQVGAALAGAFSLDAMTFDFSRENLALDQLAKKLGVNRDSVYGLDRAFQAFGANAGESTSVLNSLADAQARLAMGDVSLAESLAKAGISPDSILKAKDSYTALMNLARQMHGMGRNQKLNIANILGLSDASLDALSQGDKYISQLSDAFISQRRHTNEMTLASREFTKAWVELTNALGGAIDPLSTQVTKMSTDVLKFLTDATSEGSAFRDVLKSVAENADKFAIALGALVGLKGLSATVATLASLSNAVRGLGLAFGVLAKNPIVLSVMALGAVGVGAYDFYKKITNGDMEKILKQDKDGSLSNDLTIDELDDDSSPYSFIAKTHEQARSQAESVTAPEKKTVEQVAEKPSIARKMPETTGGREKPINVMLTLDGEVLDRRVIKIVSDALDQAYETSTRTTAR